MTEFKPAPLPKLTPITPRDNFAENKGVWLVEQSGDLAAPGEQIYALIHLDDGVLWGRVENGELLVAAYQDWTPPLRTLTIQQCRLFGSQGELFIWRLSDSEWRGRKVLDQPGAEFIPEHQLLLGNREVAKLTDDFMAIREESTGLRQVVPRTVQIDNDHRLALLVHHYLSEDEDGQAIIKCSRLVGLEERDLTKEVRNGNRQ
ncbi:MAG: TIGR03984 family CRISPR-associated protein [Acidobacteria bacterium]|nr:TIGR03984 family CRISPR-associated protein [Acidobacteriota bacterium]MBI3424094.1 TIGR03984 family CRISPR-associated protein [Acidobacteriota bacterium]